MTACESPVLPLMPVVGMLVVIITAVIIAININIAFGEALILLHFLLSFIADLAAAL